MAKIIGLPKLSPTMEEGTLASWAKKEGDSIEIDDLLAEVETDKATMEFRSFDRGVLLKILAPEGDTLKPDQPVAIIGQKGEDISALLTKVGAAAPGPVPTESATPAPAPSAKQAGGKAKIIGLPKLSPTMEEGTLASWAKKEGDEIGIDDLLAEVETDKATMEFRSFDRGVLLKILAPEGTVLRPDQPVAIVGEKGADISELIA
ncbi:MAG: pyruvate dehydrogenase, partial [Polyangiaceae bacterium]|nr:pyruvate dehydrogenase [Polyangiaceae bacterium]